MPEPLNHIKPKFQLGRQFRTQKIRDRNVSDHFINLAVDAHQRGDWGEVGEGQRKKNEEAISNCGEIISVWRETGIEFWVITSADRSVTKICLPEESM